MFFVPLGSFFRIRHGSCKVNPGDGVKNNFKKSPIWSDFWSNLKYVSSLKDFQRFPWNSLSAIRLTMTVLTVFSKGCEVNKPGQIWMVRHISWNQVPETCYFKSLWFEKDFFSKFDSYIILEFLASKNYKKCPETENLGAKLWHLFFNQVQKW